MHLKENQIKKAWGLALSLVIGAVTLGSTPAMGSPGPTLQEPGALPPSTNEQAASQDDILLLMPNAKSGKDDIKKALDECHGTVVGAMGTGELKVLIIKTEKGKLAETEKKLGKSKVFGLIQRNHKYGASWVPNDPQFSNQWHLSTIRAPQTWLNYISSPATMANINAPIAIFDSGCNSAIEEMNNYYKVSPGFNAMDPNVYKLSKKETYDWDASLRASDASSDAFGHGTEVASVAAAHANNNLNGAGVAPGSSIYPVRITDSTGQGDDIGIVGGLLQLMKLHQNLANLAASPKSLSDLNKINFDNDSQYADALKKVSPLMVPKIMNCSYYVINGFSKNDLLQKYFKKFHDVYGGIIFITSGNKNINLTEPRYSYMNVVSAIDKSMKRASFSNTGDCVTLTAPGKDIVCTDNTGAAVSVSGTSFAAPMCAAVASLVWGFNPNLTNTQVEDILKRTAVKPKAGVTRAYGEGLINAEAAVKAARGG